MTAAARPDPTTLIVVGMITAPHGVRGAVRVKSYTARAGTIFDYDALFDASGTRRLVMRPVGEVRGQSIVRIEDVTTREAAEALRGTRLHIPRGVLARTEEDEFYLIDLIGLSARLTDGGELGTVRGVADFGAGDVVEIARPDGRAVVVPFTRAVVPEVRPADGYLVIDPPDGLLEEPRGSRGRGRARDTGARHGRAGA